MVDQGLVNESEFEVALSGDLEGHLQIMLVSSQNVLHDASYLVLVDADLCFVSGLPCCHSHVGDYPDRALHLWFCLLAHSLLRPSAVLHALLGMHSAPVDGDHESVSAGLCHHLAHSLWLDGHRGRPCDLWRHLFALDVQAAHGVPHYPSIFHCANE